MSDSTEVGSIVATACSVEECEALVKAFGLCKRHYGAEWERRNRAAITARKKRWRAANRAHVNAQAARYRQEHPERYLEASARWLEANPERRREVEARHRQTDDFRLRNREQARRRRAKTLVDGVDLVDYAVILAEHGMVCHICGGAIASFNLLHFDHVIPLAKGGPHEAPNIRPAHALCNLRKAAKVTMPAAVSKAS